MKVGDFAIHKYDEYFEIVQIIAESYTNLIECRMIDAFSDKSKAEPFDTFYFDKNKLLIITDEKEIHRLNKLVIFK